MQQITVRRGLDTCKGLHWLREHNIKEQIKNTMKVKRETIGERKGFIPFNSIFFLFLNRRPHIFILHWVLQIM